MSARHVSSTIEHPGETEFTDPATAVAAARERLRRGALRDEPARPAEQRRIGLELEFHLVDLAAPARRPGWSEIQRLVAELPPLPSGSAVTVEPGGQLELSTPPAAGVAAAVAALRADRAVLAGALGERGFGTAPLGTDIARTAERVNPGARYVAMEAHFSALQCAPAGRTMMCATAALQLNFDAGPATGWARRLDRLLALGPTLVALSACSPMQGGSRSGWRSMRQQAWYGIDARRGRLEPGPDPSAAWADYALNTPVMLVRDGDGCRPVTERVPLRDWLAGTAPFGRRPTPADVDYHVTTLFPAVRLRGFLELRCLDAVPDRWWPALAAITATLVEDDVAADHAAECCAPVRERWVTAGREGLSDPQLHAAAVACVEVAVQRCPAALRGEVEAYAELIAAGRTPGDEVRERVAAADPVTVLEEYARWH